VARGADAVCFFQWRASRAGAEKFHSGMLPHAGPDTRLHREVRALGADLARLGDVAGTRVEARVAVLLDWHSWWAVELEAHPRQDLSLTDLLAAWYRPLWEAGIPVDFAHPSADLSGYDLVLAPNLYLLSDAAAASLAAYVAAGGHLAVGFFSGVVDERDHVHPGALQRLLGLRVEELRPLGANETPACSSELLGPFTCGFWTEDVRTEGAHVVATLAGADFPVILRNFHGDGVAWYVGTRPDELGMSALLREICAGAGVRAVVADLPPGVEAVRRGEVLFLLNHGEQPVEVTLEEPCVDLLSGARLDGSAALARFGAAALRRR
jgi:beta-galactosidase